MAAPHLPELAVADHFDYFPMFILNPVTFSALAVAIALIFAAVWTRLPNDESTPVMIYVGSYFLTYCIGGAWIGLSDGQALASYWNDQLIYIPSVPMLGAEY